MSAGANDKKDQDPLAELFTWQPGADDAPAVPIPGAGAQEGQQPQASIDEQHQQNPPAGAGGDPGLDAEAAGDAAGDAAEIETARAAWLQVIEAEINLAAAAWRGPRFGHTQPDQTLAAREALQRAQRDAQVHQELISVLVAGGQLDHREALRPLQEVARAKLASCMDRCCAAGPHGRPDLWQALAAAEARVAGVLALDPAEQKKEPFRRQLFESEAALWHQILKFQRDLERES